MRVVAYLRVSTEGQRENTSLGCQYERIEQYCAFQGHEILFVATDVETASGRKPRPGLDLALEHIYSGNADGLICLKLDRFARSTLEGLKMAAELKQRGKQLVLLNENLDTTNAIGECIFTILLAFAQLEHATIRERVLSGKAKVRQTGGYVEGVPPYGYMCGKDESGRKILIRDPETYPIRCLIFEWKAEGMGNFPISNRLNTLGIPAKGGGRWYHSSVARIVAPSTLADWAEALRDEYGQQMGWIERPSTAS